MRNSLRTMARVVLYAVLALFALCPSSQAAERCVDQREIARTASLRMPQARVTALAGDDAKRFLAAYNAHPPQTNLAGDAVVIIDAGPPAPAVFAVLFKDGCASAIGRIARSTYRSILAQLARGTA